MATAEVRQKENWAVGRAGTLRRRPFFAASNTAGQKVAKSAGAEQVLSDKAKAKTSAYLPAVNRKRKSTATQVDARRVDPESAKRVRIHVALREERN